MSELQNPAVSVMSSAVGTGDEDPGTHAIDTNGQENPQAAEVLNVDDIPEDNVEGDSSALIAEQKADPSLLSGWKAAEAGRPDFVIHRGILYQKDQVESQPMSHVCAPEGYKTSARSDGCVNGCAAVSDDDAGVGIGRELQNVRF